MIARRLVIRGTVQGVGFRHAMIGAAQSLRLDGWVRNRRDGAVEALVQGDAGAIGTIVKWCLRGPPAARVTDVASSAVDPDPTLGGFEARPTA